MDSRWQHVLSPLALRVLREIQQAGESEAIDIGELCATVGRRKTPVKSAIAELEHHGLVHVEVVE